MHLPDKEPDKEVRVTPSRRFYAITRSVASRWPQHAFFVHVIVYFVKVRTFVVIMDRWRRTEGRRLSGYHDIHSIFHGTTHD